MQFIAFAFIDTNRLPKSLTLDISGFTAFGFIIPESRIIRSILIYIQPFKSSGFFQRHILMKNLMIEGVPTVFLDVFSNPLIFISRSIHTPSIFGRVSGYSKINLIINTASMLIYRISVVAGEIWIVLYHISIFKNQNRRYDYQ